MIFSEKFNLIELSVGEHYVGKPEDMREALKSLVDEMLDNAENGLIDWEELKDSLEEMLDYIKMLKEPKAELYEWKINYMTATDYICEPYKPSE